MVGAQTGCLTTHASKVQGAIEDFAQEAPSQGVLGCLTNGCYCLVHSLQQSSIADVDSIPLDGLQYPADCELIQ